MSENVDKSVSTTNECSERSSQTHREIRTAASWSGPSSSDKEIYHTIVVNYHYSDHGGALVAGPKKRDITGVKVVTTTPPLSAASSRFTKRDDLDDVPNLSTLYTLHGTSQNQLKDTQSNSSDKQIERVNVSIYNVPSQQCAVIEEPKKLPTIQATDVLVLSDSEPGETETDCKKFEEYQQLQTSAKETKPKKSSHSSDKRRIRRLKTSDTAISYKQYLSELHRLRVAVEQKRLQLIELKMTREQNEMERERCIYEKELEVKKLQLQQMLADKPDK